MFAPLLRRSANSASAAVLRARAPRLTPTLLGASSSAPRALRSTTATAGATRALSSLPLSSRTAASTLRTVLNTPRASTATATAVRSKGPSATLRPYTLSALLHARFNSTAAAPAADAATTAVTAAPAVAAPAAPAVDITQTVATTPAATAAPGAAPAPATAGPFVDPTEALAASHSAASAPLSPTDAVAAAAEVPPEWYYMPVVYMQEALNLLHTTYGLPWWSVIAIATLGIRLLVFPLNVFQQRIGAKMSYMKPDLDRWNAERQQLLVSGKFNEETSAHMMNQYKAIQEKHGAGGGIARMLGSVFVTFPLFITMFVSLRNSAAFGPTFASEGLAWFPNLMIPDPYMALPAMTALTTAASVKWGGDTAATNDPAKKKMQNVFMALSLLMFFVTKSFPAAVCWYWFITNLFSLTTGLLLRQTAVRNLLKIKPLFVAPPKVARPAYSAASFASAPLPAGSAVAQKVATKEAEKVATPVVVALNRPSRVAPPKAAAQPPKP